MNILGVHATNSGLSRKEGGVGRPKEVRSGKLIQDSSWCWCLVYEASRLQTSSKYLLCSQGDSLLPILEKAHKHWSLEVPLGINLLRQGVSSPAF